MIWGRKKSDQQAYIWFAWYPVELDDGRWAWFHHVLAEPEASLILHWRDWTYHALDAPDSQRGLRLDCYSRERRER